MIRDRRSSRARHACDRLHRHRGAGAVLVNARGGEGRVLRDRDRAGVAHAAEMRDCTVGRVIQRYACIGRGERDLHAVRPRAGRNDRCAVRRQVDAGRRRAGVRPAVYRRDPAAAQQLSDGDAFITLRLQRVDRAQRALDAGRVQVVQQHDRTVPRAGNDVVIDCVRVAVFPVQGIHAPVDDRGGDIVLHGYAQCSAGRAHHIGVAAAHVLEQQLLDPADLAADRGGGLRVEGHDVAVCMVGELVPLVPHAGEHGGLVDDAAAAVDPGHKKGRMCTARLEAVQQPGGMG